MVTVHQVDRNLVLTRRQVLDVDCAGVASFALWAKALEVSTVAATMVANVLLSVFILISSFD